MTVTVKHSLPGRIRVRYDRSLVTKRQAALAQSLLSLQEGMIDVSLNFTTGSFLIIYDTHLLSQKKVLAYFKVLSDKYLDNQEMLDSVEEPVEQENLLFELAVMAAKHYAKFLLPLPLRIAMRVFSLTPRIFKGLEQIYNGNFFKSEVLDAAAISLAIATGDVKTASSINFLLNVGETIEDFTKRKSYADLASTMLSENEEVQLVEGDKERKIPLRMLKKGDIVAVRTGAVIPADGEVIKGEALVNQASLTGEPLAVEKRKGQSVFAGTIVQEGELFINVRATGSQTKVQNILTMIDSSQQLKVSSQAQSEILADHLVKYNFLLSLVVLLGTRNITKVMATLMVDYSCAMKLAAPIAVLSAMKEAASHGILVKGGKFLEDAAKADTIVFDKTGTLTEASPKLSRIIAYDGRSENEVLQIAACLEEHFVHPVAQAIVRAAEERKVVHPEKHATVEYIVAHGIATYLNNQRLLIGSKHFIFEDEKVNKPEGLKELQEESVKRGESLLYLAEEKNLLGVFAITDPVRPNAKEIVNKLHSSGIINCTMITGDDKGAAYTAAKMTGIDNYKFQALPEDKVKYIEDQQKAGHKVIMIGDGINDAPALAAADTGIAMGDCADIAGETASIVLSSENGLMDLYRTRIMGQRLMLKIEKNNRGIVAVNSVLMILGLLGIVTPSMAAVLHNSSTIFFSVVAAKPLIPEELECK
ncbi:MAG: heavy metal translocating P-type ATPase [Treponemataceae bacterium]